MPSLTIEFDGKRRDLALDGETVTIGREPDNSLVLEHASVSRHHCRLTPRDGGYEIEDRGSSGGTRVDGQRVTRSLLRSGQTIAVGPARLTYHAPLAADAAGESTMSASLDDEAALVWGLYLTDGPRRGTLVAFGARVRVGRSPDCEFHLDETDVSAFHFEVDPSGGGVVLRDLGSTNGTKVNGVTVPGEQRLRPGDVIALGAHRIRFDRHPPPAPAAAGRLRAYAEVALFVAIALMLWTLGVRVIGRALAGNAGPVSTAQAGSSFSELNSRDRPKHYVFGPVGEWKYRVDRKKDQLRVEGVGSGKQLLRVVRARAVRIDQGWKARGHVVSVKGTLKVSLIGYYLDRRDELVACVYSPILERKAGEQAAIVYAFPPIERAQWLQVGYLVEGDARDAYLGPLEVEAARTDPLPEAAVERPWGAVTLEPTGRARVGVRGSTLLWAEFGRMREGRMLSSPRHLQLATVGSSRGGVQLESTQVAPNGDRLGFQLEVEGIGPRAARVAFAGGQARDVRLTWAERPGQVDLYFRGEPIGPREIRPYIDEMTLRDADGVMTVRLSPPVYFQSRWLDGEGRETWQLHFREEAPRLSLEVQSGDRQRERELIRVRAQVEKQRKSGDLPGALRLLARWRALSQDPGKDGALIAAQRDVLTRVERLINEALAGGSRALPRILTLLEEYRGSPYEERLEAAVARYMMDGLPAGEQRQQARWLLAEGRFHAAYARYALARTALQMLVHLHPESGEAKAALNLLAILPRQ